MVSKIHTWLDDSKDKILTDLGKIAFFEDCCCGCIEFTDLFERPDSTDLGDDWEDCGADWEIRDLHLYTDTDNVAAVLLHMAGDKVGILEAVLTIWRDDTEEWNTITSKYQVLIFTGTQEIPCAVGTPFIVELEAIGIDTGKLRLYDSSYNLLEERNIVYSGGVAHISVCVGNDIMIIDSLNNVQGHIAYDASGTSGYWFALRYGGYTSNDGGVYFDSVYYSDHYDHDITCPPCDWCCCPTWDWGLEVPPNMIATITGDFSKTITLEPATASLNCAVWCGQEEVTVICDDGEFETPVAAYLRVVVTCPIEGGDEPTDVRISVCLAPTDSDDVCELIEESTDTDDAATCDPFHAEVDLLITDGALGCIGSYNIHVEIDEET